MNMILALFMAYLCFFCIKKMLNSDQIIWLIMGITGAFSIGYYVLPIFYLKESGLNKAGEFEVTTVLLMSILFFIFMILGVKTNLLINQKRTFSTLNSRNLDYYLLKYYKILFALGFLCWTYYFLNSNVTSYSSTDFEGFFSKKEKFDGISSEIGAIGLSFMAITLVIAFVKRSKVRILFSAIFIFNVLLMLSTAQRLFLITPIFMLVASFYVYNFRKFAFRIILTGVILLMLISPLMVFLREYQGDTDGKSKIFEASKSYNSNSNAIVKGFYSILERSDLLYVMTRMKTIIDDKNNFNHEQYLYSVISAYIPRPLFPQKPYPLSDDGTIYGELSSKAWYIIVGPSTGSLTAFGSITAYREGGWFWLLLNGFLTGYSLNWICIYLTKSSHLGRVIFVSIFVTLSIKNVPLSFFYLLVYVAPTIYKVLIIKLFNLMFKEKSV